MDLSWKGEARGPFDTPSWSSFPFLPEGAMIDDLGKRDVWRALYSCSRVHGYSSHDFSAAWDVFRKIARDGDTCAVEVACLTCLVVARIGRGYVLPKFYQQSSVEQLCEQSLRRGRLWYSELGNLQTYFLSVFFSNHSHFPCRRFRIVPDSALHTRRSC